MKKIIMTKGLPGSGKSTWSRSLIDNEPGKWKRINKDDLRSMLDNGRWSKDNEKLILSMREVMVHWALNNNFSVIVDDTNLAPKHKESLEQLAKDHGVEFEVKDFTDVPLETCIKRDLGRLNSVGEKVIKQMYKQFLAPESEVYIPNEELPAAIICDIDGTLALFGDKSPYDRDYSEDTVNKVVKNILNFFQTEGYEIIFCSGRKDSFREVTETWISNNFSKDFHLFMRKADDNRKDFIVKEELFNANIRDRFNVHFVLDDRNQVVDLWRRLGLTCLQVADGDF